MARHPLPSALDGVRASSVTMAVRFGADPLPGALAAELALPGADDGTTHGGGGTLSVEGNRMARSWAREPLGTFPDYEALWPRLAGDLADVAAWHVAAGLALPAVSECELTYVNPISAEEEWGRPRQFERFLLSAVGRHLAGDFLPPPDGVVAEARFPMPLAGKPAGELCVTVRSSAAESRNGMLGMTLSARAPTEPDIESVRESADIAFEWIVRAFASLIPVHGHDCR